MDETEIAYYYDLWQYMEAHDRLLRAVAAFEAAQDAVLAHGHVGITPERWSGKTVPVHSIPSHLNRSRFSRARIGAVT